MTLARMREGRTFEQKQDDSAAERVFQLVRKAAHSLRLSPVLSVERCIVVELRNPPVATRGLSDLVIRLAQPGDIPALVKLDNREAGVLQARLDRGDLIFLGQLDQEVVCCTCFHRGPTPFDDERDSIARWALDDATTYWSYDAMAPLAMRSAGVVAKLFQFALHEVFDVRGGRLVRGFIHDWNRPSLMLHQRLGFSASGRATAIAIPGLKWLRWESGGLTRQWVLPRHSDFALPPAQT